MSRFRPYRDESRKNYGREIEDEHSLRNDELKLGALLRIADATEAMAKNYTQMQTNLDYYKRLAQERADQIQQLQYMLRGARGANTRLRKKLANG